MFETNPILVFDENEHQYTVNGKPLQSVTKFLSAFEPAFDAEMISWSIAKKQLRDEMGLNKTDPDPERFLIEVRAQLIRQQWEAKRDDAAEHGNTVHLIMEKFFNEGEILFPKTEAFLMALKQDYDRIYKEYRCEVKVFDENLGIAGTMDIPLLRKCKQQVLDLEDFKTNLVKGICFDSISRKEEKWKHRNQFFLEPLSHLELCNYNRYVLQLSTYAYLCEQLFKVRIGRIAIRWIEFNKECAEIEFSTLIPIPYLRSDVMRICMEKKLVVENSIEVNW